MNVIESSPRLLEEIVERNPDIVGLEEVDDFAFFQSKGAYTYDLHAAQWYMILKSSNLQFPKS